MHVYVRGDLVWLAICCNLLWCQLSIMSGWGGGKQGEAMSMLLHAVPRPYCNTTLCCTLSLKAVLHYANLVCDSIAILTRGVTWHNGSKNAVVAVAWVEGSSTCHGTVLQWNCKKVSQS
jgi:hypothetical protein